uniref:Large ribosomal subunit protein uL23c n=1 Tax=Koliella corcontica TaxID=155904 RepID=A0A097KMZ2_9CHLO|nr:ribosomal protein L23 [Koliella corcontica]AIT94550.1 ribosomal protein L23 [Koliella corcontica]
MLFPKHLVKCPILSEKAIRLLENNQYTFDIDLKLSKPQVKKLIENLFSVNVTKINTHIKPRKEKRFSTFKGFKKQYKRVIFTLKEGQVITAIKENF